MHLLQKKNECMFHKTEEYQLFANVCSAIFFPFSIFRDIFTIFEKTNTKSWIRNDPSAEKNTTITKGLNERRRVCSAVSTSLQLPGLYPARLLCPWDSPGRNIGVCCHALLQGNFLQGLNHSLLYLLHCRQMGSLPLAPPGKPTVSIYLGAIQNIILYHMT